MLDLIIKNGKLVCCDERELLEADIGIKDGKIEAIGNLGEARKVYDAKRKCVSAGFIDIHMHEEDLKTTKGKYFDISLALLRNGVTTAVGGNCGAQRNDLYEFASYIKYGGYPINYMSYVGHNYLRQVAGNENNYKKSSLRQIAFMKNEIEKAVDFGAVGISYGLEYSPGIDMDEMVRITEGVQGRDNLLTSMHYRNDAAFAMASLKEMEELALSTKIPMQISHISSLCAFGNMEECLDYIQAMRNKGLDIMADAYPYGAFSAKIGSSVYNEGCFERWGKSYESVMLAEEPYKGIFCNKELFYHVREMYPEMYAIAMVMNEDEIKNSFKRNFVMVGSDGGFNNRQGHPRGAGTFARVLGQYVREEKVIDFFDGIAKMTILPAKRLGIDHKKGVLREGYDADIVIFDKMTIIDGATFEKPQRMPKGVEAVFVNGDISIKNNVIVDLSLGRFLKSKDK